MYSSANRMSLMYSSAKRMLSSTHEFIPLSKGLEKSNEARSIDHVIIVLQLVSFVFQIFQFASQLTINDQNVFAMNLSFVVITNGNI